MNINKFVLACLALCLSTPLSSLLAAEPLRIDLSAATGRRDAETFAWSEWEINEAGESSKEFAGTNVALRSNAGQLSGFLWKPGLATGATLASDGVKSLNPIEVVIEGLPPGPHTLITYHNFVSQQPTGKIELSIAGQSSSVEPTYRSPDDFGLSANCVEFEAKEGEPVTAIIAGAESDAAVVLNGLEIDGNNPRSRAYKPFPQDFVEHADGETGKISLAWQSPDSAKKFRVYFTHNRDWNLAAAQARDGTQDSSAFVAETTQNEYQVEVDPHDGLEHYCWRVDALDENGKITRGNVWSFRVRHLAFPLAEGYGRFAIGGRGGKVLHVTNLNDSGPGSLREAVEADGPRTVVFDVSGRIDLESSLVIRSNYLTIAGQTAPGKGICISNYNLGMLGAHDNIVRFLRVRPGNTSGETLDGMGMASCDHSIVDHCSISWTQDESFSSRGAKNITLQRTLISEALNIAGHRKYKPGSAHGFAASIGGDVGTFHHNLLAHCAGRNWSLAGGIDQASTHAGRLDIRNNVVYNWDYRTTDGGAKQVNFVNNYYKPGPASQILTYLNPQFENPAFGPQQYFVKGNITEGFAGPEGPTGSLKGVKVRGEQDAPVFVKEPFYEDYVQTQPAEDAYVDVLSDVGCNVPVLDDHDQRVLRETRTGTTTYQGSVSGKPGLPDSQEDVGGWESYPEIHRPKGWDTDGDGMPNEWEVANSLDPDSGEDGSQDADGDGYTNLEEYLNQLATPAR